MRSFKLYSYRSQAGMEDSPTGAEQGVGCVNEVASYIAGERWSDDPKCVDPVVRVVAIEYNDSYSRNHDLNRSKFAKELPWRLVGTWAGLKVSRKRFDILSRCVGVLSIPKFLGKISSRASIKNSSGYVINQWMARKHLSLTGGAKLRRLLRPILEELIAVTEIKEPACAISCGPLTALPAASSAPEGPFPPSARTELVLP